MTSPETTGQERTPRDWAEEQPEKINSGYGTFLFESNAFDEIVYFINLSFGYFIVVRSS